jgi:hypothetical protein
MIDTICQSEIFYPMDLLVVSKTDSVDVTIGPGYFVPAVLSRAGSSVLFVLYW